MQAGLRIDLIWWVRVSQQFVHNNIYHLKVLWGQESKNSFVGCLLLKLSHGVATKLLTRAVVIARPTWLGLRDLLLSLVKRSLAAFTSLWVVRLRTSVLQHVGFSTRILTVWKHASPSVRGQRESLRWKLQSFYNLISEMICHHFCPVLYIRRASLGSPHTQGEAIT